MLDGLIRWSVRNRLIVVAAAGAFLAWGAYQTTRMPVDVLPDLTSPTVTVLVEGHGMAPTDMENLVTFPIETALNGAAGVRRVRSATAVGIAVIWVDFEWDHDVYRARQTVAEKLAVAAAGLPDEVEPPALAPLSSIMGEIMFVGVLGGRGRLTCRSSSERLPTPWDLRRPLALCARRLRRSRSPSAAK